MIYSYPACFFKEKYGYSVIFPDLNYMATCGETLEETYEMANEALSFYIEEEIKDGNIIPIPSDMYTVSPKKITEYLGLNDCDYIEAFVDSISWDDTWKEKQLCQR